MHSWYCIPRVNSQEDEFLLDFYVPGTSEVQAMLSLPTRLADDVIASKRVGVKFTNKSFRNYFLGMEYIRTYMEELVKNL